VDEVDELIKRYGLEQDLEHVIILSMIRMAITNACFC